MTEQTEQAERYDRIAEGYARWWAPVLAPAVARLLDDGLHYADISRRTGASTATITRIASWLNHGEGGYRAVLDKRA